MKAVTGRVEGRKRGPNFVGDLTPGGAQSGRNDTYGSPTIWLRPLTGDE